MHKQSKNEVKKTNLGVKIIPYEKNYTLYGVCCYEYDPRP